MNFAEFMNSDVFSWVILPALIFVARIFDVSIGTIRIIFVSRGKKHLAPVLGFFEVMIWIIAISQIMKNLNNFLCYIAYAAGFSAGTYIGMLIEEKLAMGVLVIRIIMVKDECNLKERLTDAGFGVTVVDGEGANGQVKLIYSIIKRKSLDDVLKIINMCDSKAFYSIEDARAVYQGIFPGSSTRRAGIDLNKLFRADRKRK